MTVHIVAVGYDRGEGAIVEKRWSMPRPSTNQASIIVDEVAGMPNVNILALGDFGESFNIELTGRTVRDILVEIGRLSVGRTIMRNLLNSWEDDNHAP